ncbi:ovochymase-1 [Myripristis murdjan]|uniref:Ovochymase 1 n=1 Tax=Myripristis murdjan TaxID=586833 RepID=A0A667ZJX2_9TELE|nr:transmembrane protease serine 9-like [Myripristis murdjan]
MLALFLLLPSVLWHGVWHVECDGQSASGLSANTTIQNTTSDGVNKTQDNQQSTLSQAEEGHAALPGQSGFSDLAGIRVFLHNTEVRVRIIGGQEAWAHSWPWQVSLRFASMPACGGAIIAPQWIVTAAHCFRRYKKASFWTVLAGKHDLDKDRELGQQVVGVTRIISHQGYNTRTKDCDVALVKLQAPLVFSEYIRPIDIWATPLTAFRKCTITGWGSTRENGPRVNRLQEVNVTTLSRDVCNQYYRGRILPSMFCAGEPGGGADACQGDSGGPLSCFTGSRFELAGLVSWGVGCGRARKPGVYTKLQNHAVWISDVMSDQNEMSADSGTSEEESCGETQKSSCPLSPLPAGLTVSHHDEVSVGNVTEACPNLWPWQVSLQSRGRHYCSGTLIHSRWVLAPQHCDVKAKEDTVVLGVHDLRFWASQTIPVDKVVNLPQDGSFPPASDLSLLRLSVPARYSANVFPVCLPDDDDVELDDSWSCVTTGWGATEATAKVNPHTLHHARLALVNQTACRQRWGGGLIRDSHICSDPAGCASCMGDSGAPLFCRKHGVYYLFGLVTWGSTRCDADKPAVFSSISAYLSWITEVTDS